MKRLLRWWRIRRSPSHRWIREFEKIDISGAIREGIEDSNRLRKLQEPEQ